MIYLLVSKIYSFVSQNIIFWIIKPMLLGGKRIDFGSQKDSF